MYCWKCGEQLRDGAVFCVRCGTNMTEAVDDRQHDGQRPAASQTERPTGQAGQPQRPNPQQSTQPINRWQPDERQSAGPVGRQQQSAQPTHPQQSDRQFNQPQPNQSNGAQPDVGQPYGYDNRPHAAQGQDSAYRRPHRSSSASASSTRYTQDRTFRPQYSPAAYAPVTAPTPAARLKKLWNTHPMWVTIPVAIVVAIALTIVGLQVKKVDLLPQAMQTCQAQVSGDVWSEYAYKYNLSDGGRTLTISNSDSGDHEILTCICNAVDMPNSVRQKINNTRALDGTLTDTWDDVTATWTYHPDDGINMVLEVH